MLNPQQTRSPGLEIPNNVAGHEEMIMMSAGNESWIKSWVIQLGLEARCSVREKKLCGGKFCLPVAYISVVVFHGLAFTTTHRAFDKGLDSLWAHTG